MSQPQISKPKQPVDILQSMINAILIETGKALRVNNKESGRTVASANARLRTTIPAFTDNFHQALDELECDIIQAKSVLSRDLEELRSKRIALENPEPILEPEPIIQTPVEVVKEKETPEVATKPMPKAVMKREESVLDTPKAVPEELKTPIPSTQAPRSNAPQPPQVIKVQQDLTPPSSVPNEASNSNPIGLGINTEGTTTISAPGTADLRNNSIDSLFDISDADQMDINFDEIDFSVQDSGNTQTVDQSQSLSNEFDLSSFGNTQDLNLSQMQDSVENHEMAVITNDEKKPVDDLPNTGNGNAGDSMDIDLDFGTGEGDESLFDDMFFGSGEPADMDNGGEMEHDFDEDFFGIHNGV